MKQLSILKVGTLAISLQTWKGMPKQSKTPENYSIKVNGAEVKAPQVALTGGGAFPAYTYLQVGNEVKWFSGHFEAGTAVEIIDPASEAAKGTTPAASAAQPEVKAEVAKQPKQPKQPKSPKK